MQILEWSAIISMAVKQAGKPAVYVSNHMNFDDEDDQAWKFVIEQIKFNYEEKYLDIMGTLINTGLFLFDSEAEQYKFYGIFEQSLTYAGAIYACTLDADGNIQTENT
jgi:hypothetical protein